jgi:RNA polymerase sigma factor (sigma-70 family)
MSNEGGGLPPVDQNPYRNASDDSLARAMAAERGEDDAAWREFLRRYGDRIMRVIRYCGQSMQEVDRNEVFVETITRVQAGVHRFRARGTNSLGSWSYRIGQNATLDWFRRPRAELIPLDQVVETLCVESGDQATGGDAAVASAALDRALECLCSQHQLILGLTRAGWADSEIGARLGIAGAHVRKVRYKALKRLQALLMKEQRALKDTGRI